MSLHLNLLLLCLRHLYLLLSLSELRLNEFRQNKLLWNILRNDNRHRSELRGLLDLNCLHSIPFVNDLSNCDLASICKNQSHLLVALYYRLLILLNGLVLSLNGLRVRDVLLSDRLVPQNNLFFLLNSTLLLPLSALHLRLNEADVLLPGSRPYIRLFPPLQTQTNY